MTLTKGNKAIASHATDGKDLYQDSLCATYPQIDVRPGTSLI
jgi:hypothetical protein